MTDNDTLAHYNIKDFGKLTSHQISCYQYLTGIITSEPIGFCYDNVCLECGNNHRIRGNFEGAITFIDMLPELFPEIFKSNKLQEFVN
jgi:hypothetical protein